MKAAAGTTSAAVATAPTSLLGALFMVGLICPLLTPAFVQMVTRLDERMVHEQKSLYEAYKEIINETPGSAPASS